MAQQRLWVRVDEATLALLDQLARKTETLLGVSEAGSRSAAVRMSIRATASLYGLVAEQPAAPEVTAR